MFSIFNFFLSIIDYVLWAYSVLEYLFLAYSFFKYLRLAKPFFLKTQFSFVQFLAVCEFILPAKLIFV